MLNILRRAEVFDFMIGPFNLKNEDIDDEIANYDDIAMEMKLFGQSAYLHVDFLARETKIPCRGGATFNSKKKPKVENIEMTSKICKKKVYVPKNGLRMLDVPHGLYKYFIQLILGTIMIHHKKDISGDCMRLVIYWVEDRAIYVPHLLDKKLHYSLEESKKKNIKFSFPGTLQKIIDLYRLGDQTSPLRTYIRR
jgi:hypothetical protein